MRILFVVSDRPLSSTARGGSGTVFGGLLALFRSRGDEVHLLLLRDTREQCRYEEWGQMDPGGAADLEGWVKSIGFLEYGEQTGYGFLERKVLGLLDPQRRAYPFLTGGICQALSEEADCRFPDLILAADLQAGLVVSRLDLECPVVYYHHDCFWNIARLREGGSRFSPRRYWGLQVRRRAEERVVREADACITGSAGELQKLENIGAKRVFLVSPIVTKGPEAIPVELPEPCRIVHLGGFGTTATRLGLERFLDVVWPTVRQSLPDVQLWVVGDVSAADRHILDHLERVGATVTGFVGDLSTVLRPGDLHVIPWERDTGVRTRVVTCFQFGQALVAVNAGVAGFKGLQDGRHALLVDHLEEMIGPLVSLAADPRRRKDLAKEGRQYLLSNLTLDAVLPRFNAMVHSLVGSHHEGDNGAQH